MVKRLIIRISDVELGEVSKLSSEELDVMRTEIICSIIKEYGDLTDIVFSRMKDRVIYITSIGEGFSLLEGAKISDLFSEEFLIKEFIYKTEYDPVTEEEPYILIEVEKR